MSDATRRVPRVVMGIVLVAAAAMVALGGLGALGGALVAAREAAVLPPVVVAVALLVSARTPAALPVAAAWAVGGAALAVGWRGVAGIDADAAWLPVEDMARWEVLAEIGWLLLLAIVAWRGVVPGLAGPLLAAVVATTRIGAYGAALLPALQAEPLGDAVLLRLSIGAGFVAGVAVLVLAGWALSALVRLPGRLAPPALLLAGAAMVAAVGRLALL